MTLPALVNILSEGRIPKRVLPSLLVNRFGISQKEAEKLIARADKLALICDLHKCWVLSKQGKTLSVLSSEEAKRVFLIMQAARQCYGQRGLGVPPGRLRYYNQSGFLDMFAFVFNLPRTLGNFQDPYFAEILAEAKKKYRGVCPTFCASQIFDYISVEVFARHGKIIEYSALKQHFTGKGLVWFNSRNDGDLTF